VKHAFVAAAILALLGAGCGKADIATSQQQRLDSIRTATEVFADPDEAVSAGYRPFPRCVESDDESGAIGLAYLNLRLDDDKQVDLLRPELLYYEEQAEREPVLVGVGYLVPDEDQRPPKTPLGHMEGPIPAVGPGQVDRFELHAWVHRSNPDGPLATFNPRVRCLD
jgi:hypothetical protein